MFNGGGYHALGQNTNKTIETRLSVRPLPGIISGLQFSYGGAYGKGNTSLEPDYTMHTGIASFESQHIRTVALLYNGTGNYKGSNLAADGDAADFEGYSGFCDAGLPGAPFHVFGQYDHLVMQDIGGEIRTNTIIAGVAWYWHKQSKIVFDFGKETMEYDDAIAPENLPADDIRYKLSIEVNY
ncbi:MAG: hypothetical protein CL946_03055 [Ectothiorhodospiraceae bacterium]|nr:hypothetical protein [Ectothiorhodospiraceae bacterium]